VMIFALKLFPSILSAWSKLCKQFADEGSEALPYWPCYLLQFFLLPASVTVWSLLCTVAGTCMSFRVPSTYLQKGYRVGFGDSFQILLEVDEWGYCFDSGWRIMGCFVSKRGLTDMATENGQDSAEAARLYVEAYWDRFASQCIQSTSCLLSKRWISLDAVKSMDPSIVQTVPAIALLDILADSVNCAKCLDEDILWSIDGTHCTKKDQPPLDHIAQLLWPKIMSVKHLLDHAKKNQKSIAQPQNVQILQAMICNNTDDVTTDLKSFIQSQMVNSDDQPDSANNKLIRSKLIELTLILLRVKPFQDQLNRIFDHEYDIKSDNDIYGAV